MFINLCSLSNDPNDPFVLTPIHFLFDSPLHSLPPSSVTLTHMTHLDRYKLSDAIGQLTGNVGMLNIFLHSNLDKNEILISILLK